MDIMKSRDQITHIYLDYNASAPLLPEAWQAMKAIFKTGRAAYNASTTHYFGRLGQKYINDARSEVAKLVGVNPDQVIFNSGATEGNNTVLHYFSKAHPDDMILISAIEHPSILEAQNHLDNIELIPVDKSGLVDLDMLEKLLQDHNVPLVSCMFTNNETGVIQDVSNISKIVHKYGALFHCDATQAVGHIPINMQEFSIDFMTFSSHKIGGPQGAGALVIGTSNAKPALLFGGGQEKSLRAGTQNIAAIAGFGAACKYIKHHNLEILRDKLETELKNIAPEITIFCENIHRLPNTSFFYIDGIPSQNILIALDLQNIAISSGSACSSGTVKPSTTLKAMGISDNKASNALRISTGWATKESDIDEFLDAFKKIYTRIKNKEK